MPSLKEHLATLEQQFEAAKAVVYRTEGAIQMLQHLIAEETPQVEASLPPKED